MTSHPFEALSALEKDYFCPICSKPMLPCLSFGCHQICGPCAGGLPDKHTCPTCNTVSEELPTHKAILSRVIAEAVATQFFRCCLCQEILSGPIERDAHAAVCAAVEQQPEQQQQLTPERQPAPSKPAGGAAPAASSSTVETKQCSVCAELLPRASFSNSQWARKDGVFRCSGCVQNEQQAAEQQRRRQNEEQKLAEQARRREKEEPRRRKEEEERRRKEEEKRRREQEAQRLRKEEEQRRREQEEQRQLDEQWNDALMHAASSGDVDLIRVLIARPDFARFCDLRNKDGVTALQVASLSGFTECVQVLLEGRCDVTPVDADGNTAVHLAARQGHADIIRVFIAAPGFKKVRNLRNKHGKSALDLARQTP